jgi:uncharacterized protein
MLILTRPDYEGAIAYAFHILETKLPPNAPYDSYYTKGKKLHYHGIDHTRDFLEVLHWLFDMGKKLGCAELGDEEKAALELGGVLHDIGFTITYKDHEEAGVKIAERILPDFSFGSGLIELESGLIRATKVLQGPGPLQSANNPLEEYMCDPDVYNFARTGPEDGFFPLGHKFREEKYYFEKIAIPLIEWYSGSLNLQERHKFLTEVGRKLGEEGKEKNIQELRLRIGHLQETPEGKERAELEKLYLNGERFELPDYFGKRVLQMPPKHQRR